MDFVKCVCLALAFFAVCFSREDSLLTLPRLPPFGDPELDRLERDMLNTACFTILIPRRRRRQQLLYTSLHILLGLSGGHRSWTIQHGRAAWRDDSQVERLEKMPEELHQLVAERLPSNEWVKASLTCKTLWSVQPKFIKLSTPISADAGARVQQARWLAHHAAQLATLQLQDPSSQVLDVLTQLAVHSGMPQLQHLNLLHCGRTIGANADEKRLVAKLLPRLQQLQRLELEACEIGQLDLSTCRRLQRVELLDSLVTERARFPVSSECKISLRYKSQHECEQILAALRGSAPTTTTATHLGAPQLPPELTGGSPIMLVHEVQCTCCNQAAAEQLCARLPDSVMHLQLVIQTGDVQLNVTRLAPERQLSTLHIVAEAGNLRLTLTSASVPARLSLVAHFCLCVHWSDAENVTGFELPPQLMCLHLQANNCMLPRVLSANAGIARRRDNHRVTYSYCRNT